MCLQTKGLRIDEVVDYWYQKYPWTNLTKKKVEELMLKKLNLTNIFTYLKSN
jgi:mannitol-1-/sugar-/sorbitol-6-/2-deoxyglucose-6-phosphatase